MADVSVADITGWVDRFARDMSVDPAGWRVRPQRHSCMVSQIHTEELAHGLARFLKQHGLMAEVLAPTADLHTWSVVALLP